MLAKMRERIDSEGRWVIEFADSDPAADAGGPAVPSPILKYSISAHFLSSQTLL